MVNRRSGPVEAVIFDWGGTLAEFVRIELVDAWRLAAHHLAGPEREAEMCERLARVEAEFWATTATHQRSATLADLLSAATAELEMDVAEAILEEAALLHLDAWTPHIRHHRDAPATLAALREAGLEIGLLSNTHWPRSFHERFLERDGLLELIDARLYTSEMAYQKPHPAAFAAACQAVGVSDPSRAVFVGDRPWDDITGAQRLGMRAVLRPNPLIDDDTPVTPDAVIEDLFDLVAVVGSWTS